MAKLLDEFISHNYSAIVDDDIELDSVEYQKITDKIQEISSMVKAKLPESDHKTLMQYSDSITNRTIVSNGLYYKRGFTDGIAFLLQALVAVGN